MGWDDVLAAVGGGLEGASGEMHRRDTLQLERDKMAQAERLANMKAELQQMIQTELEKGRNDRYATPSANVVAQQTGAGQRAEMNFNLGSMRDTTTRRGQDINQQLGTARDTTTRRGQDMASTDRRRGQNLSDEHFWDSSARLYQGMQLGDSRARMRDAVDAYGHVVTAGKANRSGLGLDEPAPVPSFGDWYKGAGNIFGPTTPAPPPAAPTQTPAAQPARGRGRGAAPTGNPEAQARQLIDQIRALESKGQDATAQRRQLDTLRRARQ